MTELKKTKVMERECKICHRKFIGPSNRTTCGSTICMEANRHGNYDRRELLVPNDENPLSTFTEQKLMDELCRRGMSVEVRPLQEEFTFDIDFNPDDYFEVKFGIASDPHICSRYQQLTYFTGFYQECYDLGITQMFVNGDICEGNGRQYKGQDHEMFITGVDNKEDYIVEHFPKKPGMNTVIIGGSHDNSFMKENGHDVLAAISERRDDITSLGYFKATIYIDEFSMMMMHGSGAGTYAWSHKIQKYIDQMAPTQLPNLLTVGHFHYACYIPGYKDVECFIVPCFQGLTPYLKEKGLAPVIGGIILTLSYNPETGVWKVTPDFRIFKEEKLNDY